MAVSSRTITACASTFYLGSALFLGVGIVELADQPLRAGELLSGGCATPQSCDPANVMGVCNGGGTCGISSPCSACQCQKNTRLDPPTVSCG